MIAYSMIMALYLQADPSSTCQLRVPVTNYSGRPAVADVSVLDASGATVSKKKTVNGVAEFCDLIVRTSEFSIVVGWPGCGQVEVKRLENQWSDSGYTIPVLYQKCHNSIVSVTLVCPNLLRFVDPEGLPIRGATVGGIRPASDANGYYKTSLGQRNPVTALASREGYVEQMVELKCAEGAWVNEQTVTLIPVPGKK